MNELALFAGAGGGILGGKLLGWKTICAVEWEPYPASVLCARQNEGILPPFPIWSDIRTFDGKPWRGLVDVVSGGFPCQDISAAGKGDGLDGERSSMWFEMARVVGEVRPQYVFVENSPMLTTRGGTRVIGDLAEMGYDCRWTVMGAADVGANHQRDRIWIVGKMGDSHLHGQSSSEIGLGLAEGNDGSSSRQIEASQSEGSGVEYAEMAYPENSWNVWRNGFMGAFEQEHNSRRSTANGCWQWWEVEPDVGRVVDGLADRVDRLKAIGNGQVPLCAATAWKWLTK